MRVEITAETLEVRLSRREKIFGLMGNIRLQLSDLEDIRVVDEPLGEVRRAGLMAGLRVPWLYYVARTIRLDEVWIVRRGVPALSFAVRGSGTLKRVILSTPEAEGFAQRLRAR